MKPIHPGEILKTEFMIPLDLSVNSIAKCLGVTPARISDIVRGRRGITADTALRLAAWSETSAEFWMRLQNHYDLEVARNHKRNSNV